MMVRMMLYLLLSALQTGGVCLIFMGSHRLDQDREPMLITGFCAAVLSIACGLIFCALGVAY